MLLKCCTQYASKFGRLSSGHRTRKVSFHSSPKERQCQRIFYCTIALISHTSKVLLKILQARLQQYMNRKLPDVQAGFRKGRERNQRSNCQHPVIEKAREFQKTIYFCFIDYTKAFDFVDHNQLWKILQEMGIPEHFTCLLRNLYAGEVAQLEPDMKQWTVSKFRKMYVKALYCHPAYLTYMQSTSCEMQ